MKQIVEEISIGTKKASIIKQSFTDEISLSNDTVNEEYDNIPENQYNKFISLFSDNIQTSVDLQNVYLLAYKQIVKTCLNTTKNSVYSKTAQELGTSFSGASLLVNVDFFKLIDVQSVKDSLNKKIKDDPCMVLDTESNEQMHPLKIQMIREAFLLAARAHIIDYSLRNIFLTSIFNNNNFYEKDSSYANFVYETFVQRIQAYPKYYSSLSFYLQLDLEKVLSNNKVLIDPITKQNLNIKVPLSEEKEEIDIAILQYIKFLISQEMLNIGSTFNNFFNRSVTQAGVTVNLSPLINVQDYFLNSFDILFEIISVNLKPIGEFFFFIEQNTNAYFCLKIDQTRYVKLINLGQVTIDNQTVQLLRTRVVETPEYKLLFNYCFNFNKALNFASVYNILLCSRLYNRTNLNFEPCIISAQAIHRDIISDIDSEQQLECEEIDFNFQVGLNADILRLISETAIQIVKSIEETYDPNIIIAKLAKDGAEALGAPDLSIIPYSAYLMVPPPFGPSIFPAPPLGYVYWGISAAEALKNSSGRDLEISGSFAFKDPLKKNC